MPVLAPCRRGLFQLRQGIVANSSIGQVPRRLTVVILIKSTDPLIGIIRVIDAEIKFEITEDLAQKICTELDRFLTG